MNVIDPISDTWGFLRGAWALYDARTQSALVVCALEVFFRAASDLEYDETIVDLENEIDELEQRVKELGYQIQDLNEMSSP